MEKSEWKEPKVVELTAFNIVGISTQTSNANEITEQAKIPQLWDHFYQQNIVGQIDERKMTLSMVCIQTMRRI